MFSHLEPLSFNQGVDGSIPSGPAIDFNGLRNFSFTHHDFGYRHGYQIVGCLDECGQLTLSSKSDERTEAVPAAPQHSTGRMEEPADRRALPKFVET